MYRPTNAGSDFKSFCSINIFRIIVKHIVYLNIFVVTFQSQLFFASQAFAGIWLASSGHGGLAIRPDKASEMPAKACEAKNN